METERGGRRNGEKLAVPEGGRTEGRGVGRCTETSGREQGVTAESGALAIGQQGTPVPQAWWRVGPEHASGSSDHRSARRKCRVAGSRRRGPPMVVTSEKGQPGKGGDGHVPGGAHGG